MPPCRTAHIASGTRIPGRHSAHVDEPVPGGHRLVEDGPGEASLDACVAWALARAETVVIRIGGSFFVAGGRRTPGEEPLPPWPPSTASRCRAEREAYAIAKGHARG